MGTPGWRPGLSQNALSLATSTRAVASSAGWAQTSWEGGARSHPCACTCACGRGHADRDTRMPGEQLPGPTSRLCSRSRPRASAQLGPQPRAPPHRPGGSRRPTPAMQAPTFTSAPRAFQERSVKKCASGHTPSTPRQADTGRWLAGQAQRPEAGQTVANPGLRLAAPTQAHGARGPRGRGPAEGRAGPSGCRGR